MAIFFRSVSLSIGVAGIAILAAGCSQDRGYPRQVSQYSARTFLETTSVFGSSFSADETRILITSDASGVFNVYSQPVAGGPPTQLTDSTTDSCFAVAWFPHDDRVLYTSDQGGNELNHLFVREMDGTVKDLTPGENLKANFVGWSQDKSNFFVLSNERDPNYFDLYHYATDGYARERIYTNTGGWAIADVSRDGRWAALMRTNSNADSDIFLADLSAAQAEPRHLTEHKGDVLFEVLGFTPDSAALYYTTNQHSDFAQAWQCVLETGEHHPAIKAPWDVEFVSFSEKGRYRVSGINADALTEVTVVDTRTQSPVKMPKLPEGNVTGVEFSRSESKMAFYLSSDITPANLYVWDMESGDCRRLTDTLNPNMEANDLVPGQVVRYQSFDGMKIPAILYRPWSASASSKAPALVWVHGGPGGQSRRGYSATIQHLVNHGYAVLAVNNRGSSGYGTKFFHLDDKRHGDVDLQDCVHGRRYLESLGWVDGKRIGIIGGSYGGYMVVAALAFEPQAFDVGIDIFGVTNWLRTLESIPPWWAQFRDSLYAELGDPAAEKERLRNISPLFYADKIARPILVVQGANDPRVLKAESDEIVEAVRKNGVPVEYVVFPDEGHGFLKKENRIAASEAFVRFLQEHLK